MLDRNEMRSIGGDGTPSPESSGEATPVAMMAPPNLPLGTSSFQAWNGPYLMNHGHNGSSSCGNKHYFRPPETNSPPLLQDDNSHKKTQNPSLSSDDVITSGAGKSSPLKAETVDGVGSRGRNLDPDVERKRLKRTLSNRLSAQKSRMKKLEYVIEMERKVQSLESQIRFLSPQVALYKDQHRWLVQEQNSLNQQISAYTNNKIQMDAEIEQNKAEVNRLRQLQLEQQQHMHSQTKILDRETGMLRMANQNFNRLRTGEMAYLNSNPVEICGDNTAAVSCLDQHSPMQQQAKGTEGQAWLPSSELAQGQMLNPSLNQYGMQLTVNVNSNLVRIDQMQNYNNFNRDTGNYFV